ncbi:FAD/NAD(P)-binding protein [Nocardioides sp. BP30]|uniref:FAD/NAD(P)-binding protein n=1 Tax=Nocardioides sp. BP30 TaxID=3036374 RepID=UPI00246944AD|nr:FAD/NAD(P)-binding protein [Nocardioides sp. BP30]WGL52847.1 FAD/NAD(P)-binding protein [Nocardioides sp. BP30]
MTVAAELRPASAAVADRVVIIGGGASGTLTALNLLRTDARVHVTVFEPTGRLGSGVAYGTTDPRHLLNVRAGNMSAFPQEPGDLLAWAEQTGRELSATDFLPRKEYGEYLRDRLAEAAGHRLRVIAERVEDISVVPDGYEVRGHDGTAVVAPSVVLAHGNEAPRRLAVDGQPLPRASWHVDNPWQLSWIEALAPDATVVVVGTGLTAIDTAISVLDGAPGRSVVMVSRHGLLPQAHIDCQCVAWVSPLPAGPLTADQLAELYREQVAAAAEHGVNWHHVVDGFRGPTQSIWARLPLAERERFLAVYARAWEVRRHRMAPQIAARLDAFQAEGRLRVSGGGIDGIVDEAPHPLVRIGETAVRAHAVVNCTGPQTDVTRSGNPLLDALLQQGLAAPDELRLGLSCTPYGELLDPMGQVVPGLLTVGPPRKGTLYETTAIPEIRVQAAEVAAHLRGPRSLKTA